MLGDEDRLFLHLGLHVSFLESFLGILVGFEADETSSVFLQVYGSRSDSAKLGEKLFELIILEVVRKVLDEKVGVLITLLFSIFFLDVALNLDLLSELATIVELLDSFLSALLGLELDITKTS